MSNYSAPGLDAGVADKVISRLEQRLVALIDLQLTLKHVHWNVVGPNFIAVHEMLDPQTEAVRGFTDAVAERIATLGGAPIGLPGHVAASRTWDDYSLGRDAVARHLGALDEVYTGVITDHRIALREVEDLDPISHDLLVEQTGQLELFQWFVRAHLESADGTLASQQASGEQDSADAAARD
jgi:starvation-inducible DNA-binding protein